jgi:hypothetical protein
LETKDLTENQNICMVFIQRGSFDKEELEWGKQWRFCYENETNKHQFSHCKYPKILWGLIFVAFNVAPPRSVCHLFGTWLNQFGGKLKRQTLAGASAFC